METRSATGLLLQPTTPDVDMVHFIRLGGLQARGCLDLGEGHLVRWSDTTDTGRIC